MLNAYLMRQRIPLHLKGAMEYYPDVLLFELTQDQYRNLWKRLSSAHYIYTNGYELKPVGWFMYAFESIKGWLGFENHCQAEKVSYTLSKLAYYGYSKKFTQPDFNEFKPYSLSPETYSLAAKAYSDSTTNQLQRALIAYFLRIQKDIGIVRRSQQLYNNHQFGSSWMVYARECIPLLDPQDEGFIWGLINTLTQDNGAELNFLAYSKYARMFADYYYNQGQIMNVFKLN